MKIEWIGDTKVTNDDRRRYPHGYWYAQTDDGGYDAVGPDPLTAVANLASVLEKEIAERSLTRHEEMVRAQVADEIARDICEPMDDCAEWPCPDCIRHEYAQRLARRIRGDQ